MPINTNDKTTESIASGAGSGSTPPNRRKRVKQMSVDGALIEVFPTLRMAAGVINGNHQGISMCCHGKQNTHAGYRWEFEEGG